MPVALEERVDRLETVFASFMERTEQALMEMRADVADIRASSLRTDVMVRDMQRQAERDRKEFNKRMAEISDSVGTLVEDMVYPNAGRIFSEIFPGDAAISILQRALRKSAGESMEIDLLASSQTHVMLVEARRRLRSEDAPELREKVPQFTRFFPEYADHQIVLVIASVVIHDSLRQFLTRQKIYGLAMGDETMELVNRGEF
jgi:hypothetical protein